VFQASCCQHWYECSECHDEVNDHLFEFEKKLKLFCKTCNRTFECNLKLMSTKDKYCFSCGTCWCIPGKQTAVTQSAKICVINNRISSRSDCGKHYIRGRPTNNGKQPDKSFGHRRVGIDLKQSTYPPILPSGHRFVYSNVLIQMSHKSVPHSR